MHQERSDLVLQRVREYCESIIRLEGRPSDDEIQTCEQVLEIIKRS